LAPSSELAAASYFLSPLFWAALWSGRSESCSQVIFAGSDWLELGIRKQLVLDRQRPGSQFLAPGIPSGSTWSGAAASAIVRL